MLNLSYRKKAQNLGDLVPYLFLVDDGVVLNKDGSLMASWEFAGPDTASSTNEEMGYVAEQVNQSLMRFGTGWAMHVDAIRSPVSSYPDPAKSHFPDRVSRLIDEERRAFFAGDECFETRTILTLTYRPPYSLVKKALDGDKRREFAKALGRFKADLGDFEGTLQNVLRLTRLGEYTDTDSAGVEHLYSLQLSHLKECLTGQLQPVLVPVEHAMFLDNCLASQDFTGGLEPRLGANEMLLVSVDGYPESSWPAILGILGSLPLSYRFNIRFIFMDQYDALKELEFVRKGWVQQTFSPIDKYFDKPNARPNRDALAMDEDSEQAIAKLRGGLLGFGRIAMTVVLLHPDRETLTEWGRTVQNQLQNQVGFGSRVETFNSVESWRGTLPGDTISNVRSALVSTRNLSHLMPLAATWPGSGECPSPMFPPNSPPLMVCTTGGSTPFRFNLHVGDLGHTLILGPTGAGKSTFLALVCAQFRRYEGAQVFAFDKGLSLFPLCMAVGGSHYDLGGDESTLALAPLAEIDGPGELPWACDWLCGFLEIQGGQPLTAEERETVMVTAKQLMESAPGERTLYHYLNLLSYGKEGRLRAALSQFCGNGPMARYMDAPCDTFGFSGFNVLEIEHLMKLGDHVAIPVLMYLFHRVERALTGRPTLVVLDEAWVMLGHPVCRAMVREWLKVLRKKNAAVVMATQSLSDTVDSKILDVVAESCPTKVYLANPEAANDTQIQLYRAMGLNDKQISIIARGQMKRDYYVTASGVGRRQVQLALERCPKTLAFVGSSKSEDIARIKRLIALHGDKWPVEWLKLKQLGGEI